MAIVAAHAPQGAPRLSVPDNMQAIFEGCVVDPALLATDRERFTVQLAPGARAQVSLSAKATAANPDGSVSRSALRDPAWSFRARSGSPHNYNEPGTFDNGALSSPDSGFTGRPRGDAANVHVQAGTLRESIHRGLSLRFVSAALSRSRPALRQRRLRQWHDASHADRRQRETGSRVDARITAPPEPTTRW